MTHLVPLISDLALILTLAGLATILCKKFNQPLILGYMLAGFLASPHFTLLPNVIDGDSITIWADIGVIFILFDLGLDYNFNKIKSTFHKGRIYRGATLFLIKLITFMR